MSYRLAEGQADFGNLERAAHEEIRTGEWGVFLDSGLYPGIQVGHS